MIIIWWIYQCFLAVAAILTDFYAASSKSVAVVIFTLVYDFANSSNIYAPIINI